MAEEVLCDSRKVFSVLADCDVASEHRLPLVAGSLCSAASVRPVGREWSDAERLEDSNESVRFMLRSFGGSEHAEFLILEASAIADREYARKLAVASSRLREIFGSAGMADIASGLMGEIWQTYLRNFADIKETGCVFTPGHIADFAADAVLNGKDDMKVVDLACGAATFLTSALKVSQTAKIFGIEKNRQLCAMAAVNTALMCSHGSKIVCGDGLSPPSDAMFSADAALMNPPFGLKTETEHMFLDAALRCLKPGGLLFAVVPTSLMCSVSDRRGEISWRHRLVENHSLQAVLKLPQDLFAPAISKGCYAIAVQAHKPHSIAEDVLFGFLEDGVARHKTSRLSQQNPNIEAVLECLRQWLHTGQKTETEDSRMSFSVLDSKTPNLDMSPEHNMARNATSGVIDIQKTRNSVASAVLLRSNALTEPQNIENGKMMPLSMFVEKFERGKSGIRKNTEEGGIPFITTSEVHNGISCFVSKETVKKVYPAGLITVSANGGAGAAFWHPYEFAASQDVHVLFLKSEYESDSFAVFLCAAINAQSWRFGYFRKLSASHLANMRILVPVDSYNRIDMSAVLKIADSNVN